MGRSSEVPKLRVDLVAAAQRSGGSLAELTESELEQLETRYRRFLHLKSMNRRTPMAPSGAIDQMWHLHMLHPVAYQADCMDILGYVLDHNPGFGSVEQEVQGLHDHFDATARLWEQEFDEPYAITDDRFEAVVMCLDKEPAEGPAEEPGEKKPDEGPQKPERKSEVAVGAR